MIRTQPSEFISFSDIRLKHQITESRRDDNFIKYVEIFTLQSDKLKKYQDTNIYGVKYTEFLNEQQLPPKRKYTFCTLNTLMKYDLGFKLPSNCKFSSKHGWVEAWPNDHRFYELINLKP